MVDLVGKLSLLVAISALSGLISKWKSAETTLGKVLQGVLFAFTAVFGILNPYVVAPGLIFDGRTIVIGVCTMFFGPLAGGITAFASALARITIGGIGLPLGLSTIAESFLLGWLFNFLIRKKGLIWLTNFRIYAFGLLIHIVMAVMIFLLPSRYTSLVLHDIGLTLILAYPIIYLISGYIIKTQIIGQNYLNELTERESLFRTTLYSIGDAVITTDEMGRVLNMNKIAEKLTGWDEFSARGKDITKVFHIINEFSGEEVENPVSRVIKEGTIAGLANHTVLISRDGTKYPIADSGAPICDDQGRVRGAVLVFRDQTEERRAQRLLAESELRYRQFISTSVTGIWRFDLSTPIPTTLPTEEQIKLILERGWLAECNDTYAQMYGYQKAEEIIGIKLTDVFLPNDPTNIEALRYFIENGYRIENAESVEADKFGNRKYFLNFYVGIVEDKNLLYAWGMQVDITEKKQMQEEIEAKEHQLRSIFSASPDIYLIIDKDGRYIYIAPANEQLLYKPATELLGKKFDEIFEPNLAQLFLEKVRLSLETKSKVTLEYSLEIAGKFFYFLADIVPYAEDKVLCVARDITERKKLEEQIRNSAETFRGIFNTISEAIYIQDKDGVFLDVNDGAVKMYGYPKEFFIGKTPEPLSAPGKNNFAEIMKYIEKAYGGEPQQFEFWGLRSNGEVFPKDVRLYPGTYFGKKVIIALAQDISWRKYSEMLLQIQYNIADSLVKSKNLQEFLASIRNEIGKLFDTKNFFIAFYDDKKDTLTSLFEQDEKADAPQTWSAANSLTGLVVKEKKSLLLKENDISKLIEEGKVVRIGSPAKSWMGTPLIIENKAIGVIVIQSYDNPNAYSPNDLRLFEQIANNISSYVLRKKQEAELQKLFEAVRYAQVAVVITDSNGIIEYVNPKFTEITSYTPDEAIGNTPRILKSGYHQLEFYQNLWNTIKSGNVWSGEFRNKKKDGSLYWDRTIIAPIFDENRQITHFVAMKEDITESKKIAEELIKAKERAEESEKLKTAFLANISHEVRTPLNAIVGFSQLLSHGKIPPQEIQQFANIIRRRGMDLLNLFNDLIDISYLETKQIRLSYSSAKANSILYDLFTTFSNSDLLKRKNLELRIGKTFAEDFVFTTDFFRVRQILNNLIDNAIKFTYRGFVEFGGYLRKDGYAEFYVKDSGLGIPENKLNKIFERFYRLETNFLTSEHEGLGIGLSIAKGLVDLLGGKIWVESTIGEGSTFYFAIPPKETIEKTKEPSEVKRKPISIDKRRRVFMVVEDEYSNYLILEKMLTQNFNCEIIYAKDGKEAVEKYKLNPQIDLVLLDIRLPLIDGFGVFSEMRKINPKQKIIALTAYAYPEDRTRIIRFGFDDYIAKPIEFPAAIELIQKILKK